MLSKKIQEVYGLSVAANVDKIDPSDSLYKSLELLNNCDVVINEGSFLNLLAQDLVNGMKKDEVLDKHRKLIELNQNTRHKCKVINLVLVCDEFEELYKRVEKHNKFTGLDKPLPDKNKEADILAEIIGFEKSMVTLNSDTFLIYIPTNASMISARDYIFESIQAFF